MKKVVDLNPLFYVARVWMENECVMGFEVFELCGREMNDKPMLKLKNATNGMDEANSFETASMYMEGHIKWDGCTNYTFPAQNDCMLHECSRKGAKAVAQIWDRLYDLAAERMTENKRYLE